MLQQRDMNRILYSCVEHSNDAIMVTDTKGILVYVNQAWQKIYGYSWSEAIGRTPRLLRSPHQDKSFYEKMWDQILDPNIGHWQGELVNCAKGGHEVPVLLSITPYKDENGFTLGYMSVALDITERKKMEGEILRQDRLASVGLLASGLAHEIGTPLGVIRGRAEYLAMQVKEQPHIQKGLEIIISQIDRISKLIYSLLHLAKSGQSDAVSSVQVERILSEVMSLMSQQIRKLKITFTTELSSHVKVRAEPDRLEQVILNLVVNASHAIEDAIAGGRMTGHFIKVTVADAGIFWEIAVQDTGKGISQENMKNLFKPFFTTKPVGMGTGLGLAVSMRIIEAWGGTLWAESTEGQGTTFKFRLKKG